jgi:hypothetical protein
MVGDKATSARAEVEAGVVAKVDQYFGLLAYLPDGKHSNSVV